jgi:hypothetical protein
MRLKLARAKLRYSFHTSTSIAWPQYKLISRALKGISEGIGRIDMSADC